jgi:hypothetical protein
LDVRPFGDGSLTEKEDGRRPRTGAPPGAGPGGPPPSCPPGEPRPAGAVRRAPPPAGAHDDASNDGSLRQDEAQPRRPEVRPRSVALPSNDGSLRQRTAQHDAGTSVAPPGIRPPSVRPPVRKPAVRLPGGAIQSAAAAGPAAASPVVRAAGGGRPLPDDSQTGKHCPPGAPPREIGRRSDAGASRTDGAEAAESLDYGRPRFPDEDRGFPEMEDDLMESHRSTVPVADVLLEAPEPEAAMPVSRAAPSSKVDPGKPLGPDYGELRTLIVANLGLVEKARMKRRGGDQLDDADEASDGEAASKAGGQKVASAETQQEYLSIGRGLMKRFKRESDIHISLEDIDPREFANWLLGLKPFLSRNTWRRYRASAIAIIQTIPSIYLDESVAMLNADLKIGSDEGQAGKKRNDEEAVGASLRAKRIDYQHFQQLKRRLLVTTRSQAQAWLRDWMQAGINTGLRPMEWSLTTFERRPDRRFPNGRVWLHVVSAKAADGRATHRTLDLSNFSTEALEAVERMVNRSREWVLTGTWSSRQYEVSKLLRKICKTMFPRMQKHYTLYSLRHQFIANMKTIYTREEVAAMVGHISLETEVEHYGKKRVAWDFRLITEVPMPVEEQVAQIKRRLELFDERRADIAAKEAAKLSLKPIDERDENEDEEVG